MHVKRVERLEQKRVGVEEPPSGLERWWRAYLDRVLDVGQAVALAEAVVARDEGRALGRDELEGALAAWAWLWERADGADAKRLRELWGGQQAGWAVLTGG
jgi:hypothetical protein